MPIPRDLTWIEGHFDSFNVVYVDSLICQVGANLPWKARFAVAGLTPAQRFVTQLRATLGMKPPLTSAATYLDPQGSGTRLKSSRSLQLAVSRMINEGMQTAASPSLIPQFASVQDLLSKRKTLSPPDFQEGKLCAVTAVFSTLARIPPHMKDTTLYGPESETYSFECILADQQPNLLNLLDQPLWLNLDHRAFYNWTHDLTQILSVGWYPFTNVVGLLTTSSGGQPYMRVLAILMKPYPHMGQVLDVSSPAAARESLVAIMRINQVVVQSKCQEFEAATQAASAAAAARVAQSNLGEVARRVTSDPQAATTAATQVREAAAAATDAANRARIAAMTADHASRRIPSNTTKSRLALSFAKDTVAHADYADSVAQIATSAADNADQIVSTGTTPSSTSGMAAGIPTSPVGEPRLEIDLYRDLLWTPYMVQLICELHGVGASGLKCGARPTYDALRDYLAQLQKLIHYQNYLSSYVLELAPPNNVDTLVKEPLRDRENSLVIYA